MHSSGLIDSFSEFKEFKNIDRATMQRVLEDVFRGMLRKKFNSDENFDVIINDKSGDLEIWHNRTIVHDGEVEDILSSYNMGVITNNERYNQVVDAWTHADNQVTDILMKELAVHKNGFNSVYMMIHSGARGSKQQIKQLCGLRGLMAKPRKSGDTGGAIIENPILSNFKDGFLQSIFPQEQLFIPIGLIILTSSFSKPSRSIHLITSPSAKA